VAARHVGNRGAVLGPVERTRAASADRRELLEEEAGAGRRMIAFMRPFQLA
jgi:hypothetical protein